MAGSPNSADNQETDRAPGTAAVCEEDLVERAGERGSRADGLNVRPGALGGFMQCEVIHGEPRHRP
jgi:hypothetical protein